MFFDDNDAQIITDDDKFAEFWTSEVETVDAVSSGGSEGSRRFLAAVCIIFGVLVGVGFNVAGSGDSSAAADEPQLIPLEPTIRSSTVSTTVPTTVAPAAGDVDVESADGVVSADSAVSVDGADLATGEAAYGDPGMGQSRPASATGDANPLGRPTEADFAYRGAFTVPAEDIGNSTFAWGGLAAAFNRHGDLANDDEFGGSLFMTGHPRINPGVAEVAIPEPQMHFGSAEGLPVAEVLQPFVDISEGRALDLVGSAEVGGIDEFRFGGLEVVDAPTGPRLHWTAWQYHHVTAADVPSHGHSNIDLSDPDPEGPWFLGDYANGATSGYLFKAPVDFADAYLDGHRLLSGYQHQMSGSRNSWGPPFFAYTAPVEADPLTRLDAIELVNYPYPNHQLTGHDKADLSPGADWITTTDGRHAVIVTGNHHTTSSELRSSDSMDPCSAADADPDGSLAPRVMFYDPADLASVAGGRMQPWDVQPYWTWNPVDYLIPTCDWLLSSVSFDPESSRMYVVQFKADVTQNEYAPVPVVHVFDVM